LFYQESKDAPAESDVRISGVLQCILLNSVSVKALIYKFVLSYRLRKKQKMMTMKEMTQTMNQSLRKPRRPRKPRKPRKLMPPMYVSNLFFNLNSKSI